MPSSFGVLAKPCYEQDSRVWPFEWLRCKVDSTIPTGHSEQSVVVGSLLETSRLVLCHSCRAERRSDKPASPKRNVHQSNLEHCIIEVHCIICLHTASHSNGRTRDVLLDLPWPYYDLSTHPCTMAGKSPHSLFAAIAQANVCLTNAASVDALMQREAVSFYKAQLSF